jgi:hypothetical protein
MAVTLSLAGNYIFEKAGVYLETEPFAIDSE